MDRRNFIGSVGAAVAAALAPGKALARLGFGRGIGHAGGFPAAGYAFDHYVSPTGDDNNLGTLASPWSITFINNNQSTYAGKVIGFLPGVYQYGTKGGAQTTLYSLMAAPPGGTGTEILSAQGGPSASSPTVFAACNSSGVYVARTSATTAAELPIIDCSQPGTGTVPTADALVMGQLSGHPAPNVGQYGNWTIDGLVFRNYTTSAIFSLGNDTGGYLSNNIVIKNCEFYNALAPAGANGGNPGTIFIQWAGSDSSGNPLGSGGVVVHNCLFHDISFNDATQQLSNYGFIQFKSFGTQITNCTNYNCGGYSCKDGWQEMNISYCYIGWGGVLGANGYSGSQVANPNGTICNYLTRSGATIQLHHNIVCGPINALCESAHQSNQGTVQIYSNTFYKPGSVGGSNHAMQIFNDAGGAPGGGQTAPSNEESITTGTGSTNTVTVNWTPLSSSEVTGYRVWIGTSAGTEGSYFLVGGASSSSLTITSLTNAIGDTLPSSNNTNVSDVTQGALSTAATGGSLPASTKYYVVVTAVTDAGPPYGTYEFWNNLVYAADGNYNANSFGTSTLNKAGTDSGGTYSTISNTDYNAYGGQGAGVGATPSVMSFGDASSLTLSQWQALGFGWDAHSISLTSSPFSGTPTEPDYTTFAVTGPAATASNTGGACGAVDGSGAIGCSFWQGAL